MQELKKVYPKAKIVGFFYDPNIHPFSEYYLRLIDVQRSCKKLNIELIEGEYNYKGWLEAVRGFENEPEKGKRCLICFDNRLETTAKEAKERGFNFVTTTLLTSPKKSLEQLEEVGKELEKRFKVKFLLHDFRVNGGTNRQFAIAKRDKLYHQDYCGCLFALTKQRENQERLADELFSPINRQLLPESIESRIKLYQKRVELEEKSREYKIIREKFLNYRLLRAFIKEDKRVIPSYILAYSFLKRRYTKGKVAFKIDDIYYFNREEIKLLSIKKFNQLSGKNFKNTKELIFNPILFKEEIEIREKIIPIPFSTSPIIIIDEVEEERRYEISIESKIYQDVRERLIL